MMAHVHVGAQTKVAEPAQPCTDILGLHPTDPIGFRTCLGAIVSSVGCLLLPAGSGSLRPIGGFCLFTPN